MTPPERITMTTTRRSIALLASLAALAACDGPSAAPIEGGGARGGPASGTVVVFALDEGTGAPVEGAEVAIAAARAHTDANGRATIAHEGPIDVTVSAPGYLTERWLGVDAAELTIPLSPSNGEAPVGTVRARLDGLAAFVPSGARRSIRAVLGVTRDLTRDPTASVGGLATCSAEGECAPDLEASAGRARVYAQIDEVDELGARVAPLGFAISDPIEIAPGAMVEASLRSLERGRLRELSVTRPQAPLGIEAVVGVPGLTIDGQVVVLAEEGGDAPFLLPEAEGNGSYWAVAVGTGEAGSSRSIVRLPPGEHAATLAPPPLRAPPAAVEDGGGLRISGADGAAMITVTSSSWRARAFDARSAIALPEGAAPARVCVTDAERPAHEWRLYDLEHAWSRRACTDL
ncbi:MAG TPA: carboxypeptidase regulatory-like domain-containing protein [Sandaracinaceae bacterium]